VQKLIPPYLFLISLSLMAGASYACFIRDGALVLNPWGTIAFVAGLVIVVLAKKQFRKLQTTVQTFDTPDRLVISGLFRHSRNPMYLGLLIALAGAAVATQCVFSAIIVLCFFGACRFWYIAHEERVMLAGFGDAYQQYCAQTRRWI